VTQGGNAAERTYVRLELMTGEKDSDPSGNTADGDSASADATKKKTTVKPGKVKLTSVKKGKRKATVRWKTVKRGITGYEVRFISRKTGKTVVKKKFRQTSKMAKKSSIKKVIKSKKLKKGRYKVRVRAYVVKGGKTIYGPWSNTKTVKLK